MTDQKSLSSRISPSLQEAFVIKRIGEPDIEISRGQRDAILKALTTNKRFVQVGEHTVMLNAIKGIDPKWRTSTPPRPEENRVVVGFRNNIALYEVVNEEEIARWDALYGKNL